MELSSFVWCQGLAVVNLSVACIGVVVPKCLPAFGQRLAEESTY